MPTFAKTNWLGGMNSQFDASKQNFASGYYLGVNIRTRSNTAQSVRGPLDITLGLPENALIQGIYTFDTTLLAFADGLAYIKTNGEGPWFQITDFAMSPTAAEIDCCLVPSSSVNFQRNAPSTSTQTDNAVVLTSPINASPQCLIVMDGVSQPRVIFPDGTNRLVQTYAQWTSTNPEYVPIARYPAYVGGILYCVGKDLAGNYTQIFHSVSGRPLDFVILLKQNGDKISGIESEGGAQALANRVSYNPVTALGVISANPGAFLVSTRNGSWIVTPNYEITIAAEPTFSNQFLFDIGAVTKTSVVDVLGDTTVVCRSGIRSFNGVMQSKWQGKNSPFSAPVNNFISNQEQTVTAGTSFDDYALYALSTAFGPGVLVYDFLQQAFVSVDLYKNVGLIKQFAKVQSGVTEKLYFYTADNKVYQAFAGNTQRASVFLNELVPATTYGTHRVTGTDVTFSNITQGGFAGVTIYADKIAYSSSAQELIQSTGNATTPIPLPFSTPTPGINSQTCSFSNIDNNSNAWRQMIGISWTAEAAILDVGGETQDVASFVRDATTSPTQVNNTVLAFIGNDAGSGTERRDLNSAIRSNNTISAVIGAGNHAINPGTTSDIANFVTPFWGQFHDNSKFFAVHGGNELGTVNGEPFYNWLQQAAEHYSWRDFGAARVFFITAGYKNNGTQVEPSNLDDATIETSTQFTWLRTQLGASTAAYNIVVMFDTIVSSNPAVTARFADFPFKAWGCDLLVTGSGGMYERLSLTNGLPVLNVGTGGGPLYTGLLTTRAESRKILRSTYGYLSVTVHPLRCSLEFKDTTGAVLDTFSL